MRGIDGNGLDDTADERFLGRPWNRPIHGGYCITHSAAIPTSSSGTPPCSATAAAGIPTPACVTNRSAASRATIPARLKPHYSRTSRGNPSVTTTLPNGAAES